MFLHLLNENDGKGFLAAARLISLVDSPLLWEGKTEAGLTGKDDLSETSFQKNEAEEKVIQGFEQEVKVLEDDVRVAMDSGSTAGDGSTPPRRAFGFFQSSQLQPVEKVFLEHLKSLPFGKMNASDERIKIGKSLLNAWVKEDKEALPSVAKLMLFELISLALADGVISDAELQLLREFGQLHGLDSLDFDDLLVSVKSINQAAQKAISIIFE